MPLTHLIRIPQRGPAIKAGHWLRRGVQCAAAAVAAPRRSSNATVLSTLVNRPQFPPGIRVSDVQSHFLHTFLKVA